MKKPASRPLRTPQSAPPAEPDLTLRISGVVALVMLTLLVYLPVLRLGFIWDDDQYITENPYVQRPAGLYYIWFSIRTPQYYPLVFTMFWGEHLLWGLNPVGYHLINIFLHAANAVLVWVLARRLKLPAAWLIAAVFAVHPVHVESVAWITERKNVLSGLFYFLSLLAYLRFDDSENRRHYAVSLLCFVLALLSKSATAVLAPGIVLILLYRHGRAAWRRLSWSIPYFALGAASGFWTAYVELVRVGAVGEEWSQPLWVRSLLIAPTCYWFYFGKIVCPYPIMFIYPRWEVDPAAWDEYLPLAGAAVALAAGVWLARRGRTGPLLLLLYAAASLFPALGFGNVYFHRFSWVADHFQYLGSLGFIALAVIGARAMIHRVTPAAQRATVSGVVAAAVVCTLSLLSARQGLNYENPRVLWERTLEANPKAWIAMINVAHEYMQAKEYEKAEEMYRRGLEYAGGQDIAAARLAQLLIERKRPGESTEMIKRLVDIQRGKGGEAASMPALGDFDAMRRKMEETPIPQRARAWYNVALGQLRQKQFAQALKSAEWAVKFAPDDARCLHVHGVALMENQRYDEAIPQLYSALQHDPSSSEAAEALVVALTQTANYAEAVRVAGETLDRDATNQALSLRLAWLLAAAPDDAVRDGARALQIVRPLAAASSTDPAADDVLGAALAETGAFNEAIAAAGRALDKVRKRGEEQVAADISQRLEEYRQSRPHRLRLSNAATSLPAVGPPAP